MSPSAIRRKADAAEKPDLEAVKDAHATRSLRWCFDDTAYSFSLWAELPADQGAVLAAALTRMADRIPASPKGQEQPWWQGVELLGRQHLVAHA